MKKLYNSYNVVWRIHPKLLKKWIWKSNLEPKGCKNVFLFQFLKLVPNSGFYDGLKKVYENPPSFLLLHKTFPYKNLEYGALHTWSFSKYSTELYVQNVICNWKHTNCFPTYILILGWIDFSLFIELGFWIGLIGLGFAHKKLNFSK
jgi:hypothetical protein